MKEKMNRSFKPIVWLCVVIIMAVTGLTIISMPLVSTEYQSAVGSTAGSIIGTLLAFLGALYLWTKEQSQLRKREQEGRDRNLLRDLMANIGTLSALGTHHDEANSSFAHQEQYLASIRMDEAAAMIASPSLKADCQIIASFARPEGLLDALFDGHYQRLHIARQWLLDLFALNNWEDTTTVRPRRYKEIESVVEEVQEHYDTLTKDHEEWLKEQKARELNTEG